MLKSWRPRLAGFDLMQLNAPDKVAYTMGMRLVCAMELLAQVDATSDLRPWGDMLISVINDEGPRNLSDRELMSWRENTRAESSEEWMHLTAADLARFVEEERSQEREMRDMISHLEGILGGNSGFEGISSGEEEDDGDDGDDGDLEEMDM
jgi:hypothetical protein